MSKAPQPAPQPKAAPAARRIFDPAALPIVIAAMVLVGVVVWLFSRPLPSGQPVADGAVQERLASEVATLRTEMSRQPALEPRLAALEGRITALADRPAPEPVAPVRAAAEAQAREAQERINQLSERLNAAERNLQRLADRPAVDPATVATRQSLEAASQRLEAVSQRTEGLSQRIEAVAREDQARDQQATQRIEGLAREAAARQAAQEQATAQSAGRLAALEATAQGRGQEVGTLTQRIAQLEAALQERTQAANALQQRIAALEGAQQRIAAVEGRSARLAAIDALRTRLEAGRPLGDSLGTLREPPQALSRFAGAAPPTEAQLRLSFEEAARAARTASEPAREGQGVLDSAAARLTGLLTVRRGDEMVVGDEVNAELERARRALEAGDIEGALRQLERLPPRAKEAMREWMAQAQALVAARAALRDLAAG